MFERFSVFAGAASIGAVASVCCDDTVDEVVVMDAVVELVDQSLVIAELGDVSARYRSLETMRAFARDRLRQRGDLDRFERAHAAHVAAQMGPLTERLRGADELAALRELDQLWPDLRSAVAYAIGEADTDLAVRLVSGLAVEAMYRERIEVSGWADQILDLPGAEVHHLASELLATAAVLDWRCGRAELGYSRAEKAYGICLAEGRPPSVAVNLAVSACGTALGDHDIAPRARADTLARIPAGDLFTRVFLRQLDSMFSSYWGEPRMALKILDEIEPESQRLRNPLLLAQGAWVRMVALLDVEPAAAVDVGNVAVDAAKAIRALWVVDAVTNYLTSALAAAGDLDDALQGVRVVLEHMADGGGVQSLANTARNGLLIFDRLGLPTEAATVVGWLTAHGSEMPGTAGMRQRATEVIQRVEANLDAQRFAVAASHGQTFNDRDLVDFMLQHLPGA